MTLEDKFIISCKSWNEFWTQTKAPRITKTEKGKRFERLTQLYLQVLPTYQSKLSEVWLLSELPKKVFDHLDLPQNDEGIDLIAKTRNGEYWAIQSKFTSNQGTALNRKKIGTFISLTFNTCKNISWAVLAHTSDRPIAKHKLLKQTFEIGLDAWRKLDQEISKGQTGWDLIKQRIKNPAVKPEPRLPKPHQLLAIADAKKHYLTNNQPRGRMIMPCGTGKSLTAFWVAQALQAKTIIVAVPSLALIRQSLDDWTREFVANDIIPEWACICSDDTVGDLDKDSFVSDVYETGIPTYRDIEEITVFLRRPTKAPKVIFTTYQSSDKLSAAVKKTKSKIQLAILDEAHKTVGHKSSVFSTLLHDKNIKIDKRLFMTATERVLRGQNDDIVSMNEDVSIYGTRFHQLTFKQAIDQELISDYKIVTQLVSETRIKEIIEENLLLNINSKSMTDIEAQSLAAGIAIKDLFKNENLKHAISFHRSIETAKNFAKQQQLLNSYKKLKPKIDTFHISSKKSAREREALLDEFKANPCALISNARCLTEGIDVPAIDCVFFADPKKSTIDIVQATGRALRKYKGKRYGYVVVPLIVPEDMGFSEFAETTPFRHISRVITALSTQDERIVEEFKAISHGKNSKGRIVSIEGDVPVGMYMQLSELSDAVRAHIWADVGRGNWRPFEEARDIVRNLGLKKATDWFEFAKSNKCPPDIPASPHRVYIDKGWISFGDWLGTGAIGVTKYTYRSFAKARNFAQSLKLSIKDDWDEFCRSADRPYDIPTKPDRQYKNDGWAGYGDWLGTGNVASFNRKFREFKKARSFARSLGLISLKEWQSFAKSTSRPKDIPSTPSATYAEHGWINWSDWLGTKKPKKVRSKYLPFKEARDWVHTKKFNSVEDWLKYAISDQLPSNIPKRPYQAYQSLWLGYGDWLGNKSFGGKRQKKIFPNYVEAQGIARSLGFTTKNDWVKASRNGLLPDNLPKDPRNTYKDKGWSNWSAWLGVSNKSKKDLIFRNYSSAKNFVHSKKLTSVKQWNVFSNSSNRPSDIPANPARYYKKLGWISWYDWLGVEKVNPKHIPKLNFNQARAFARTLKLNSQTEWLNFCRSGKKPDNIPYSPSRTYRDEGWISWGDWLGTGSIHPSKRNYLTFELARQEVRRLNIKSVTQWHAVIQSNNLPKGIPSYPEQTYAKTGWSGWSDWLGNGNNRGNWQKFTKARKFSRKLNLKRRADWIAYVNGNIAGKPLRPVEVPKNPQHIYLKTNEWKGWKDWLGY